MTNEQIKEIFAHTPEEQITTSINRYIAEGIIRDSMDSAWKAKRVFNFYHYDGVRSWRVRDQAVYNTSHSGFYSTSEAISIAADILVKKGLSFPMFNDMVLAERQARDEAELDLIMENF